MTFNVSFKITDESISLQELVDAGYTIEQAEHEVNRMIAEVLQDELSDDMRFSCLRVEYDH